MELIKELWDEGWPFRIFLCSLKSQCTFFTTTFFAAMKDSLYYQLDPYAID